jgi:hypothetical protein
LRPTKNITTPPGDSNVDVLEKVFENCAVGRDRNDTSLCTP